MKAHLIQPDGTEEVWEYTSEPTLAHMQEFVGGGIELVSVLYQGKRCHMIVHEEGSLIPLEVNAAATLIYHEAVVKPDCLMRGNAYNPQHYAQIYGPAMLFEGMLS